MMKTLFQLLKRARGRRGYTLVEAMMTAGITGIVASTAPTIFHRVYQVYELHNAKVEIQRDARVSLDIINRFLRQAQAHTVVIDQVTNQPPYSRISFRTVTGQNVMFYQSGKTLYQVNASTTSLSANLRYIAFTYPRSDDPSILQVAITMEHGTFQGRSKALELSIEKIRIMN